MRIPRVQTDARNSRFQKLVARIRKANGPWYHKHFHGRFFFLFAAGEGFFCYPSWATRWLIPYGLCFSRGSDLDWFWDINELTKAREALFRYVLHKPSRLAAIRRDFIRRKVQGLATWKRARSLPLSSLSDTALFRAQRAFRSAYYPVYGIGAVSEVLLTTGAHDWFEDLVADEVRGRISETALPDLVGHLAAPIAPSAVNREHASLLAVALAFRNDRRLSRLLRLGKVASAERLLAEKPRLGRLLHRHVRDFFWIEHSYEPRAPLTPSYFLGKIAEWFRSGVRLSEELQKERARMRLHREIKRTLIRRYRLSRRLRTIIALADLMTEMHDFRKEMTLMANAFLHAVLMEVARRRRIPFSLLTRATPAEIERLLLGRAVSRRLLQARARGAVFFFTPTVRFAVLARQLKGFTQDRFFGDQTETKELRGVVAAQGTSRGRVHVILDTSKLHDFKKGEILVTNNTTPEFVPAMRRAAAILTEQGGLTTHAAIVSRELGVPCIIGVTNVTKLLKTGERVEVDATKGIVRILSRSKIA